MIIQCRQCRTKFRFNDALMEGDGLWMRCSRCQHVFFQDNPSMIKAPLESTVEKEPAATEEPLPVSPLEARSNEQLISGGDEDVALFLDNVMKAKSSSNEELVLDIEKPAMEEMLEKEEAIADELPAGEGEGQAGKSSPKLIWKILKVALWVLFVIIVIPAIIYFFVYPQMGDRFIKLADQYLGINIQEFNRPKIVTGQVKLQDIRQRILNNYALGPIRVVEGIAVNQADYPISRIMIKGEIVDAYAVVLGERSSYAGNVLTDEELTVLTEEEISRRLAQPEGRNNSNDKIVPNAQIPFMIVFVREPKGVIKTTVMTMGAERLL